MKISYVNNHYQLGGAETVVRQLHEGILARGHISRLHVTEGKSWPRIPGLKPLYPRILAKLDHSRAHSFIQKFAPRHTWTDRSFRNLAAADSDIIHLHSYHGTYASLDSFAYLAKTKPLVWTFHGYWGMTGGCDHPFDCNRYQTGCGKCPQIGRFAVGPVDHTATEWREKQTHLSSLPLNIIAPSQHLATRVRESALGQNWKVHVIPNGVDPVGFSGKRKLDQNFRRTLKLSPDRIIALFICRDFKETTKGFPLLQKVLSSQAWPDLQVVLIGGNSTWARSRLPSTLKVVDQGYVRDRTQLAAFCEASDLFLYASAGENFPCVILEAMASECCVVTSPVDGVLEQIEDGISGLIAKDHSPEALAATLTHACSLPLKDRHNLGINARKRVENEFSEATMIKTHLELYAEIVQENDSA